MNKILPSAPADAAIILNGARAPLDIVHMQQYRSIIVVDGAWNDIVGTELLACIDNVQHCKLVVLGDGDSIAIKPDAFIETPDQNFTDFEKSLQYVLAHHHSSLDVYWGDGGEGDHYLGNLSVAAKYSDLLDITFYTPRQWCFLLTSGGGEAAEYHRINGVKGTTVSLYPFPSAVVSSEGLRYPLNEYHMDVTTRQSVRNHADSDEVNIAMHTGQCWLFVERL